MAEAAGISVQDLGLLTDLYQLTMAQSYFEHRRNQEATFSLFIRQYPPHYTYFVAAGLVTVLEYLEQVHFPPSTLAYLRETGRFSEDFLTYLAEWKFRGDVMALPEGCLFFVDEPVVEVTAPIIEAQLVESFMVNAVHMQTLIASKASRCVQAAQGRSLIDFALRRTHGTDAAMKVARASYLAGFASTSNVLAGQVYDIPIAGTMAHSYVTCFPEEIESFRAYAATYPQQTVLLIDTYDTLTGAKRAAVVGQEMARRGYPLLGVRLDSGDMTALSKDVRAILDEAGLQYVRIVASGGFDEFRIEEAVQHGACIDVFGVGTKMGVAADAPYYDMAYKLVRYDGQPVMKLSPGKVTLVDEKQIWRRTIDGQYGEDLIALRHETLRLSGTQPLLRCFMRAGQVVDSRPTLAEARVRHAEEMARLPQCFQQLKDGKQYPVRLSQSLENLQRQVETSLH